MKIIIDNESKLIEFENIRYEDKNYKNVKIEIKINNDIKYYFELDDNLNKSELEINKNYNKESIYIMQYDNNNILIPYGVVIDIFKNK